MGLYAHYDHAHNHPATARTGKPAHEEVVAGRFQFHPHSERAHRPFLSHIIYGRFHLRGRLERDAIRVAVPPQLFGWKAGNVF